MLFCITTLLLAVAPTALLAAPTASNMAHLGKRELSKSEKDTLMNGDCDLSFASMPVAPQALPGPSAGLQLSHVAIGRGTQNYTCADNKETTAPKLQGALATLYNMTCMAVRAPPVLAEAIKIAMTDAPPNNDVAQALQSGHHEFTETGVPLFKLSTNKVNYGYVKAKAVANTTAPADANKGPNNLGSVSWLKLVAVEGDFSEIFRVQTAGGVAPKTCKDQPAAFQVAYAAEYWFWR